MTGYQPPKGVRTVVLRNPVVIERGAPLCGSCGEWAENGRHDPVAECTGNMPSGTCPSPEQHHRYRPQRWWRRVRRAKPWEFSW